MKLDSFLLPIIIAIGGFLRFYRLGEKGLWLDEAFSVWMGWQSLADLFGWLLKIDQHPPLYYTLLHFWLWMGDDAATVRALSAFIGTLTIPIVYLIGRRIGGQPLGLLVAFILALAPFHVRFAQEARMYALLTFNASVAMLSLVHLLTDSRSAIDGIGTQFQRFYHTWRKSKNSTPNISQDFRHNLNWLTKSVQRRWLPLSEISTDLAWVGYMLFSALTLLSHNTAVFFPFAVNLAVGILFVGNKVGFLTTPTKSNLKELNPNVNSKDFSLPIVASQRPLPLGGGIKSSPLAGGTEGGREPQFTTTPDFSISPLTLPNKQNWLLAQLGVILLWSPWLAAFIIQSVGVDREFWIPPPTFDTVTWTLSNFLSPFLPGNIIWPSWIWMCYGIIIIWALWQLRLRTEWLVLLLALFLVPIIGELLISLRRPLFYDRTLIWATIPLYLIVAIGIRTLPHRAYFLAAVLVVMTINTVSLREYYISFQKEEWNIAANYVAGEVAQDDLLLFNATWVQIPFDFYFREYNKTVIERGAPVDLFDRGILEPKMTEADVPRLQSLLRQHERVWLIYSHNWYTDPNNIVAQTLQDELTLREKRLFFGLEVHLYD
ncbi:MAG: glycosyltransferase family 39 protein [Chloroflexota bacterium]